MQVEASGNPRVVRRVGAVETVTPGLFGAVVWLRNRLIALLPPAVFARLAGKPESHTSTRPIPGYLTYGQDVRLVGLLMVLGGVFLFVVTTWYGR